MDRQELACVVPLLFFLVLTSQAHAAPDEAAADTLFREGRALVKQGKYAEACPKLASSHALDPTAGRLLALGDCYELIGQTATAWTTFKDAETMARQGNDSPRAEEAVRRLSLLEPKLSKLAIELAPDARREGLDVRRNGSPVASRAFGSAVPVDPGDHAIDATAPGKQPWHTKVHVDPKPGVTTVRIPALTELAPPATSPPPVVPQEQAQPLATGQANTTPWSTRRNVGLVLGGVGVVGTVVGTVFGVQTLSKMGEVQDNQYCHGSDPPRCNQKGVDLHQEANTTANVANVAFALGIPAIVAGVVVFVTAPSGEAKKSSGLRVSVGPVAPTGTTGVWLSGEW